MLTRSALLCTVLATMACAASTAYAPIDDSRPIEHDPSPLVAPPELPPHRFEPRPHTPRIHPERAPARLSELPAMTRSGKCVPAGAVPEGTPGAVAARTRSTSVAPKTVPTRDNAETARAMAEPMGAADDGYAAAEAPMEPSDAPFASRRERRQKKRDARKNDVALSAGAAPESEATPQWHEPQPVEPLPEPEWPPAEEGWGDAVYLSNDDTMSLSSAQRVAWAIDNVQPLPPQHVRPHELLNYFSFDAAPVEPGHDFSVKAEIAPSMRQPGLYTLALSIAGRPVGRAGRRNAVLTLVVDVSGSMRKEGRMDYLKRGLLRMVRELEPGDIVHLVTFDHRVCVPLQNYVVGRDDPQVLTRTIHGLKPAGYTNLHAGLTRGYELADRAYQPSYTNRVLLVTDALANRGVTDAKTLALVTDWYDSRRIRLSGIGVGSDFDDAMLDRLTEKGRGAYVFLGSPAEVDAVFGDRFVSLIETTANDVHFRLHLPPSLRMQAFHGEESSTQKQEVQAVHVFADTSVLLLSDLEAWREELRPQDEIMVEIDYQHPETGEPLYEDHAISLAQSHAPGRNVRKAELVMHFIDGVARMAARGAPAKWQPRPGTWQDAEALDDCARTRSQLHEIGRQTDEEPEIRRVLSLWEGLCARFEGPGGARPPRKDAVRDGWPAASVR